MVAIVSGNSLGLSGSSASVLGAGGQLGTVATGLGPDAGYVNAQTGNLILTRQDELLVGVGPDLGIVRTYNSRGLLDFDNNDNWQLSLYRKLSGLSGTVNNAGSSITRTGADGAQLVYSYDSSSGNPTSGRYVNRDGSGSADTLSWNSATGRWTWTDGDSRTTETYEAGLVTGEWRIKTVQDPDLNTLTYSYDTAGLIADVTNANNERTKLTYNDYKQLTQIEVIDSSNVATLRVRYGYDAASNAGRLSTVTTDLLLDSGNSITDAKTYVTTYTYEGASDRITSISNSDGSTTRFSYYATGTYAGYINTVTDGTGNVTTFAYGTNATATTNSTTITDAAGQVTTLTYITSGNGTGQLSRVQGPAASGQDIRQDIQYTYNARGDVLQMTDSRGKVTTYSYDANGNSVRQQDPAGNVIERSYSSANQLLTETVYAVADPDGSGTATASIPQTTRYLYDAENHLRFQISPEGRVTEYTYNAVGQRTSTLQHTGNLLSADGWVQDFSLDTFGLTPSPLPTGFARVNGALQITSTNQAASAWPGVAGPSKAFGATFTAEVTTPASLSPSLLNIGIDSGTYTTSSYRRNRIVFNGTSFTTNTYVGNNVTNTTLGTVKPNTTYVVEAVTQRNGDSILYVYEKGLPRSSGYSNSLSLGPAVNSTARLAFETFNGNNAATGAGTTNRIIVDNLTSRLPQELTLPRWVQDFSAGTDGLTPTALPSGFSWVNNALLITSTRQADTASTNVSGPNHALGTTFSAEFTTPAVFSTSLLNIGIDAGDSVANSRRHRVILNNNALEANLFIGSNRSTSTLGYLSTNTTYVLEATTEANGDSTLYIYQKGQYRSSGYVSRFSLGSAPSARLVIEAYSGGWAASGANGSTNTIVVDNLSAQMQLTESDLAGWASSLDKTRLQRTDYDYDLRGQLSRTTQYSAIDSTGAGIADGSQSITQYTYDAAGNLVQRIDARGVASTDSTNTAHATDYITNYVYDGLNRLQTTSQSDATGVFKTTSTTVYGTTGGQSASPQVTTTLANGLTTVNVYDRAGRLVSTAQTTNSGAAGALGTTSYLYDTLGQLRQTTNPLGQKTYYLYDSLGRQVGEIDPEGALTETVYNGNGQVMRTMRYANAVTATLNDSTALTITLASTGVRPAADTPNDRITRRLYDAAGRLTKAIDALGAVTLYTYDGASRLVGTLAYSTRLSADQQSALAAITGEIAVTDANATVAGVSATDRATRNLYDNDGLLIGSLDAEGYLTEYRYDAAGRETSTIRYATQTASANWAAGTFATLKANATSVSADTERHQTTTSFYNAQNQRTGTIDPENYLTAYGYDLAGNLTSTIRYATQVEATGSASVLPQPLTSNEDRSELAVYDHNNRLISTETRYRNQTAGIVTAYSYDQVGNLIKTVKAVGVAAEARTQQQRYDALGRLTQILSGEGAVALASATQDKIEEIWNSYGTRYVYDNAGRRIAEITPNGTDGAGNKTRLYYDNDGRLTHRINALGEVTEYQYSRFDQVTTERRYNTRIDTTKLALNGGKSSDLDSLDLGVSYSETKTGFDRAGRATSLTDALGFATTISYTAFSQVESQVEPINADTTTTTNYSYDRRGLLKTTTADAGGLNISTTVNAYDAFGRATQTTDGRNNIRRTSYDRLGRQVATSLDNSNVATQTTYDAFDRVLTTRDGRGRAGNYDTTRYQYDSATRSMTITTAEGIVMVTTRNRHGETVSIQDGRGNVTRYDYNRDGQLLKTTQAALTTSQIVTQTAYDKAGHVFTTTDARGMVTRYTYDAADRVLSQVVDDGGFNLTTHYRFDAQGRINWTQDANGVWTRSQYDAKGQVTAVIVNPKQGPDWVSGADDNPTGLALQTSYTYDARGKTLTVTEGVGSAQPRTTEYVYDKLGRRIEEIRDPGTGKLNLTTRYTYSGNDDVLSKIDALGNVTRYTYDADNRLIHTVDALGNVTENTYDASGNVIKTTQYDKAIILTGLALGIPPATVTPLLQANSALDQTTHYVYDRDGRLTYSIDASKAVTRLEYDAAGNVVKRTRYAIPLSSLPNAGADPTVTLSANDQVEQTVYNALNRAIYSVDANKTVTAYQYTANGAVFDSTRYANALQGTLDTNGSISFIAAGSTAPSSGAYVVTNAGGDQRSRTTYDKAHRPTFTIDAMGGVTQFGYDSLGNVTQITRYAKAMVGNPDAGTPPTIIDKLPGSGAYVLKDAADSVTQQVFDDAGRKIEAIDALGNSTKTDYNAVGDIVKVTDAKGNAGYFYHDALGRVTLQVNPDGAAVETGYDAFGQVTSTVRYANKVQTVGNAVLGTGTRPTPVDTLPSESGVYILKAPNADQQQTVHYDALGHRKTIKTWIGPTTSTASADYYTETFDYDAFGNIKSAKARNGADTRYTYDLQNRQLTETLPIQSRNASNALTDVVNRTTYDAFGNVATRTEAAGLPEQRITTYAYDKLNRQQSESVNVGTTYNPVTNETQANTLATKTRTYDARGNLTTETDARGNKTTYYYDAQDRRIGQVDASNVYTIYRYDPLGNKISQTVYANNVSTPVVGTIPSVTLDAANDRTTYYSYDAVGRQTSTTIENITSGMGSSGGLYQISTGNITTQTIYDALGNVIKTTDANGNSSLTWYNNAGQTVAQVDAAGYLTTWGRDAYGNITRETRYTKKVQVMGNASLDTGIPQVLTIAPEIGSNAVYVVADSTNDRITDATFDRLNRVSSETLRKVVANTVNPGNGQLEAAATDAITRYTYDGLNNITQKTDATGAVTDWVFDKLGRQTAQINPQFTDYTGNSVRPRTDQEYDGLNNVTREIKRGADNSASNSNSGQFEGDDHITTYTYTVNGVLAAGGRLVAQKDATNAITEYQYDAQGNITKKTLKNRLNADNSATDDVTQYVYDRLNRQVKSTDAGTGLISEVQYNSFNQISGKRSYVGTAPNGWTEFAEYDQAGRVWKTNSGDGVIKVSVYDRNGNATLSISGTLDMRNMSLSQVLAQSQADTDNNVAQQTLYTISVFDQKNQLVDTIQPSMTGTHETVVVQANTTAQGVYVGYNSTIAVSSTESMKVVSNSTSTWTQNRTSISRTPTYNGSSLIQLTVMGETSGNKIALMIRKAGAGQYTKFATGTINSSGNFVSPKFDTTYSLPDDLYEFEYIVTTPDNYSPANRIVSHWSGSFDTRNPKSASISAQTYMNTGPDGGAVLTSSGLQIIGQENFVNGITMHYRIKGSNSAWITMELAKTTTFGNGMLGGFYAPVTQFAAGNTYEVDIVVQASGTFMRQFRTEISRDATGDARMGNFTRYTDFTLITKVTFTERTTTEYLDVSYRLFGSSADYTTVRLKPKPDGSGVFTWDASKLLTAGATNSLSSNFLNHKSRNYEIIVNAYEHGDILSNETQVKVKLGVAAAILDTPVNFSGNQRLRIALGSNIVQEASQMLANTGVSLASSETSNTTFQTAATPQMVGMGKTSQEYRNRYAFAVIASNGSVAASGHPSYGGDISQVASELNGAVPVVQIYSSTYAFAALRADGSVVTWGSANYNGVNIAGTQLSDPNNKVVRIFSSETAFAALRADGSVVTWGSIDSSAVSGQLNNPGNKVVQIYSTGYAFAALRADGSVVTWGTSIYGGDSSAVSSQLNDASNKVMQISANGAAFAALRADGSVVSWGYSISGAGNNINTYGTNALISVANQLNGSVRVTQIYANSGGSFAALRADGSVVTWGYDVYGGSSSIAKFSYTEHKESMTSVASQLNGSVAVTKIYSNGFAFAALRADGSVVTWGDARYGGDKSIVSLNSTTNQYEYASVASQLDGSSPVMQIFANGQAFAALRADGSIVTWGYASSGGDSSSVTAKINLPDNKVVKIYGTDSAFAALLNNGSVVAWGNSATGGMGGYTNTSGNPVTQVYSNQNGFSTLRANGNLISWGSGFSAATAAQYANVIVAADISTDISVLAFTNLLKITQPLNVASVKVLYRPTASTAAYQIDTIPSGSNGVFAWNNTLTRGDYEVIVQGFDTLGNPLTQTGFAQLRFSQGAGSSFNVTSMTDIFRFDLGYRRKGSDDNYTPIAASPFDNGVLEYRANLPADLATGDYEYRYTAYAADTWETDYDLITTPDNPNTPQDETVYGARIITHALGDGTGYFTVNGKATAASRLDWVISSGSQTNTIHRQQRYNAYGEVVSETDGNGNVTDFAYNTLGKLVSKRDPKTDITLANGYLQAASESTRPTTTYSYDLAGRLVAVKDANNNTNTQAYVNGSDDILFERHADGGFIKRSYDLFGNLKSETDRINSLTDNSGRTTQYAYDNEDRLTQITRPSSAQDNYVYDAAGQRIRHINALGDAETTAYDSLGRVTQTKSYLGFATGYNYSYNGSIVGVGGNTVGGWQKTTTDALGRSLIDNLDMFNRLTWHQDLGGHQFTYNYNLAGWLTSQTGTSGQNLAYTHYANGYIQSIWDKTTGTYTRYEYDNNGNRTFEGYTSLKNPQNLSAGVKNYYQYANISYDALNRIKSIVDPKATINYEYDAVGNRRHVYSYYHDGLNGAIRTQDYWYQYDAMNRFTVTMGRLSGNGRATSANQTGISIVTGSTGTTIGYNVAGQRIQAINGVDNTTEGYSYNPDGYLTDVSINGTLRSRRSNDALGRVYDYKEYASNGSQRYTKATTYDKDNRLLSENGSDGSNTYYYYSNSNDNSNQISTSGAGALARMSNSNTIGNSTTTTHTYYQYQYWDEAKQTAITTSASNSQLKQNNQYWKPGYSDLYYDVNGHLNRAYDRVANRDIRYVTDAQGQILTRNEVAGSSVNLVHRYYYVDGQRVGDVSNDGPSRTDYAMALAKRSQGGGKYNIDKYGRFLPIASADFDQNYEPISPTYPGPTASTYTVKNGDTLQSIALQVWGDAQMWYLIADANGLASGEHLTAGQSLTIPNKVTNLHNNSETYRVYNPGEAIGDVNPTLPTAPPIPQPKKKGCGGIGGILVAVVAVAVAVVTQQYQLLPAIITNLGPTAIAAGAAAVGNIAGQVTGNLLGVQQGFNFGSLATSVITAGATEGLLGGTVSYGNGVTSSLTSFGSSLSQAVGGGWSAVAARAVVGNVVGQGVGNLTGQQKGFSWTSVAAAGVGAAAGYGAGKAIGGALASQAGRIGKLASFITSSSQGLTASLVSQTTQIALDGRGRLNWASVATSGISAGVGALAGYDDPKNGGSMKTKGQYDRDVKAQLANAPRYATDHSLPPGAVSDTTPPVMVTAPRLSPAQMAIEEAQLLATQTADRLMQVNQLNQIQQAANQRTNNVTPQMNGVDSLYYRRDVTTGLYIDPTSNLPSASISMQVQRQINDASNRTNMQKVNYGNYQLRAWDGKGASLPPSQYEINRQQAYATFQYQASTNLSQSLPMVGFAAIPAKVAIISGMAINGAGNVYSQFDKYGEIKYPAELAISLGFGAAEGYLGRYTGSGFKGIGVEALIGASSNVGAALTTNWYYKNDIDHQYNLIWEATKGAGVGAAGKGYEERKYLIDNYNRVFK